MPGAEIASSSSADDEEAHPTAAGNANGNGNGQSNGQHLQQFTLTLNQVGQQASDNQSNGQQTSNNNGVGNHGANGGGPVNGSTPVNGGTPANGGAAVNHAVDDQVTANQNVGVVNQQLNTMVITVRAAMDGFNVDGTREALALRLADLSTRTDALQDGLITNNVQTDLLRRAIRRLDERPANTSGHGHEAGRREWEEACERDRAEVLLEYSNLVPGPR
ncbi:hypothetical protein V497_03542 [Pseudogymnoascus sp. VKM F-4516 (FW-969)]|nr:hypothetical protein V497_03542 [Pseudogymnoascus sp. VKM F-4516 (FW-969)]